MVHSIVLAVAAALFLGAVMTTGDFIWAQFNVRHTVVSGLMHGALMCLCIGGVVGARAKRVSPGLVAGPVIGVIAAAAFYVLAPWLRWLAMVPAWMLFWICFALLQQWLERSSIGGALVRGIVAAVLSGVAFYAISGIWTRPSPSGPDYGVHFLSWSFAFFPGFAVLFWRVRQATQTVVR